jgi:hypothetical protein
MFGDLFGRCGCGDERRNECHNSNSSCDVLWIIILLMLVFKGGLFGLDICTLVILFIVFGKDLIGRGFDHREKCC